jgi:glycosyltransferase involved in cell wall biosynthesis
MRELRERLKLEKISYAPYGIPSMASEAHDPPSRLGTQGRSESVQERDPNLIVTIAWLGAVNAKRKAIPEVLEAMPLILSKRPESRLVIAGQQGEAYPDLKRQAERLQVGSAITWLGRIEEEVKFRLLGDCGVYLQPTYYEGFGLAILEAMSTGAAVVTSPVGAVPEVAADTVYYCDARSPQEIASAVLKLQDDFEFAQQLGERARERALGLFRLERRAAEIRRIISELGFVC